MKAVVTEEQLADIQQRYDAGYQELVRVLEDAVGAGVTNLGFEYKGRELMVFHQVASVGLGADRIVENLQEPVIKELIKRARLAKRTKGTMKITLLRRDFEVLVEEYDSFGESAHSDAFRLGVQAPSQRFCLFALLSHRSHRMFRVSIYEIETNEDVHLPDGFSPGDAAHCLVACRSPSPTHRLVAAQGWVKCVGLSCGSLIKTLGASANLVDCYMSAKGVFGSHDLTPAPRFLCPLACRETTLWILDNIAQTWLISVTRLPTRVQPV